MTAKLKINFITPNIFKKSFSGGIYCILKYADGLSRKGHLVNVIPYPGSEMPQWIDCNAKIILDTKKKPTFREKIRKKIDKNLNEIEKYYIRKSKLINYFLNNIPEADATIATFWETAEIVQMFGRGNKYYFIQHFEPLFYEDENCIEKKLSLNSYYYPLVKIANSTWLYNKIKRNLKSEKIENKIYKCINAVDTDIYKIKRHKIFDMNNVIIISYGGRNVPWKGFMDMAEAISITRKKLPEFDIKWNVFGSAILPPENNISEYNSLGFLQPYQLVEAYNDADILLSASWYESFPLFPIEAMACGLAVVTTQPGTEDYAIQGETAEVVKEKDPESIANGLIKVIKDNNYRNHIKKNGSSISQKFNWNISIDNFEKILLTQSK